MSDLNGSELSQRDYVVFSALCALVYFASYMTRLHYAAAISEIVVSLHISNQLAGMAVISSFIANGVGQPICGNIVRIHGSLGYQTPAY